MRLEGDGVGDGEQLDEVPQARRKKHSVELKTTITKQEAEKPIAEVFLQRIMDAKTSSVGDTVKYIDLCIYTGEMRKERVRIKSRQGLSYSVQPDGVLHWTLNDRNFKTSREVVYTDYYTKDPKTGNVSAQYEEAHERVGPFYPEPSGNRKDLEIINLMQVAEVPAPHADHGLALKVKLVSQGFFSDTTIGETGPIPLHPAHTGQATYGFHQILSSEGKHIGTISLAAHLLHRSDVGRSPHPKVPRVLGNWDFDSVFAVHSAESERVYIGQDELEKRQSKNPPKLARHLYGDCSVVDIEASEEYGLGPFLLSNQVPMLGPEQSEPMVMNFTDGQGPWQSLSFHASTTASKEIKAKQEEHDDPTPGVSWQDPRGPLAVDIYGLQTCQKTHRKDQELLEKMAMGIDPTAPQQKAEPPMPGPPKDPLFAGCTWQPSAPGANNGILTFPKPQKIDQYAQNLTAATGPIPRREDCPIA